MAHISRRALLQKKGIIINASFEESAGIGISISVRKYWRDYYKKNNLPSMYLISNQQLNAVIAGDFAKSTPIYRFILKSADPGEIRKSNSWYYIAAFRGGKYEVLAIMPNIKEFKPDIANLRLDKQWLETGWKNLLDKKTRTP